MERSDPSPPVELPSLLLNTAVHAGFVLTGAVTTLLGPLLPSLADRWSLSDAQAGALFTSQFLGSTLGVILSSSLMVRRGFQFTLVAGFAMMAVGVGALEHGSWVAGLTSVFCYGMGLGVVIPVTNMFVAQANPGRHAAALNILNLAWGLGAVAWPSAMVLFQKARRAGALLVFLAVALLVMAFGLARISSAEFRRPFRHEEPTLQSRLSVWGSRSAAIFGLLFFLYVGTENSVAGWVAIYAERFAANPRNLWALTPSFFWGALLLGRGLAPLVLRQFAETSLALAGLLLAAIGVVALLPAATLAHVMAGASLAGLGLAAVFPITIATFAKKFGALAPRISGWMFALGGLGGATLPWLVGLSSTRFGGLKAGLIVPLLGCLAMFGSYLFYLRPKTSEPPHPRGPGA